MKREISKGLLLSLLTAGLVLVGCAPKEENKILLNANKMHKVNTKQKLTALLKKGKDYGSLVFASNDLAIMEDTTAAAPGAVENSEPKRDFVGTNLQDDAVDESDIIKTDGNNIYYISQGTSKFTVFNVLEDHSIVKTHEIVEEGVSFNEMYLLDDYVIIIGAQGSVASWEYQFMYPFYNRGSALYIYDVKTLDKVYSLELNYSITTTRVVDRALYVIGHKTLSAQSENVMPVKIENEGSAETLSYDDIYYFDETLVYGMTLIGGLYLDTDPLKLSYEEQGYLGSRYGQKNIYVNENNLYISDSSYYYGKTSANTSLTISQFALSNEDATATYVGSGSVKGAALNQFAMDEYEGYLRLATTDNEAQWNINLAGEAIWETYRSIITNYLYILKMDKEAQSFELVSHISEDLGKPNETIRSVRFSGDKGYIVTFLQTDPLYVIDLSNPKEPVITDAIILPGFDTYQHPWSENSLIGLGYSATSTGILNGIKLSAYDTTSGIAKELQTLNVAAMVNNMLEYRYVYSEALSNHKAILVSPAYGIFGFPIYSYSYTYDTVSSSYSPISEYLLYKIDFASKPTISELVRISSLPLVTGQNDIRRAVLIEGVVYTFSSNNIATYDLSNNVLNNNALSF